MSIFKSNLITPAKAYDLSERNYISEDARQVDERYYSTYLYTPYQSTASLLEKPATIYSSIWDGNFLGTTGVGFYDSVHFTLNGKIYDGKEYSLGLIGEELTFYIDIQSMFKNTKTVSQFSYTGEQGVDILVEGSENYFLPYESKHCLVSVDTSGPAIFNVTIQVAFTDAPDTIYSMYISGLRLTIPSLLSANWNEDITLTRYFQTSIFRSVNATQTRKRLVRNPRRELVCTLPFLSSKANAQAWKYIREVSKTSSIIPMYPDVRVTTAESESRRLYFDTSLARFAEGGLVCIVEYATDLSITQYDVVKVAELFSDGIATDFDMTKTFPAGSKVYPGMICYPSFGDSVMTMFSHGRGTIQITAQEVYGESQLPFENAEYTPEEILGYPLFPMTTDYAVSPEITCTMQGLIEESGRGFLNYVQGSNPEISMEYRVTFATRQEYWDLIGFINKVGGPLSPFWVLDEQWPVTILNATRVTLDIDYLDELDLGSLKALYVSDSEGNYTIVSVIEVEGNTIAITDAGFIPTSAIPAMLVHFSQDEVSETWLTSSAGMIQFYVSELQNAYPEIE